VERKKDYQPESKKTKKNRELKPQEGRKKQERNIVTERKITETRDGKRKKEERN
jgi:hypothetical protein